MVFGNENALEPMKYNVKRLDSFRLLSMYGYEALGQGHNMHALVEFDVTDTRKHLRDLRKSGVNISFFSYLLFVIAKVLEENKELNLIRKGKRIYYFDEIDIDVPIEVRQNGIVVPRKYVVKDASRKTAEAISLEIEKAKTDNTESGTLGEDDKWAQQWVRAMSFLPKWLFMFVSRRLSNNPFFIKKRFGTTYVTSVSGFSDSPGFAVPFIAGQTRPLAFTIGNISRKPGIVGQEIKIREFLSMTVTINHDLVDGAPAARIVNSLKKRIEVFDMSV